MAVNKPIEKEIVSIIDTGVANTASIIAAFTRAGVEVQLTKDASVIEQSSRVVLPGVGSFGVGMQALNRIGAVDVIRDRITARRPTLAVCLGMQLLCTSSEESPGVAGIGVIDASVTAFPDSVRRPQFGWNRVVPNQDAAMLRGGYAYFANSYKMDIIPSGWSGAMGSYGGEFVAAVESGPVLACQFHPEISGVWGMNLLRSWIRCSEGVAAC